MGRRLAQPQPFLRRVGRRRNPRRPVVARGARDQHIGDHAGLGLAASNRPGVHICRSEEHTSELQSLMRISYAVFCLTKKYKMRPTYFTNYSTAHNTTTH